jgi:murein DD-endopeptidase MepM/ murein hydrolase activator NlpD
MGFKAKINESYDNEVAKVYRLITSFSLIRPTMRLESSLLWSLKARRQASCRMLRSDHMIKQPAAFMTKTARFQALGATSRSWLSAIAVGLATSSTLSPASADGSFTLSWPVACVLGQTCFVQNFVDHDSSDAARDFRCGPRTYNGHDGTDIRLPDAQAEQSSAAVLAAAAGRVLRTRDGVSDVSIRLTGRAAVAGKECGNGMVIDHGQGWSTQYCHLRKGSIVVAPGAVVKAGTPLGKVGLSGETEVPHLHLTVRHNGLVVDPFAYDQPTDACSGGHSLWAENNPGSFAYNEREIINFGFAGAVATMENIESGVLRRQKPDPGSEQLVAYVRAIGLRKGDVQIISVRLPGGEPFSESRFPALDSDKAEFFVSTGRRRSERSWPKGKYEASYRVLNNGTQVLDKTFAVEID